MKQPIFKFENPPGSKPEIFRTLRRDPTDLLNLENPIISVITPCLNTGKFLEDTIRSIASQNFRSFEHIVVDGGSTDNTLEILKKYPHIRFISEPDNGPTDAFRKGLRMARGKYLLLCCASDCYASEDWFKICAEALETHPEISLVWGFGQVITEEGVTQEGMFSQFHFAPAPQKEKMFLHWLVTGLGIPEINLCARKEVMIKCFPKEEEYFNDTLDWSDFNYNFHRQGFLAYFVPVIASYLRKHTGQLSEKLVASGWAKNAHKNDVWKWKTFRRRLLLGQINFNFVDGNGQKMDIKFSRIEFLRKFIGYKLSPRFLLQQLRRAKKIPAKLKAKFAA
jgi:glycosyltransferase involved in cell wall biosynthesis